MNSPNRGREGGFTQIELMIGSVVLVVILAGIYSLFFTGIDTYAIGQTQGDLERQAKWVLNTVAEELSLSGKVTASPTPEPPFASDEVTFQKSAGYYGGTIWGPPVLIELLPSAEDPPDGIDNDGNGIVDECVLVRRTNVGTPDEKMDVLTRHVRALLEGEVPNNVDDNGNGLVDEPGFSLVRQNQVWTIRLTLERRDANGRLLMHTMETAVRPRN